MTCLCSEPVIIHFQGCGEKAAGFFSSSAQCFLISQTSGIPPAVYSVDQQAPLRANQRCVFMRSYLIVRLDMQYFHMAFHKALTSPTASVISTKSRLWKNVSAPSTVLTTNYRALAALSEDKFMLLPYYELLPALSCWLDQVR